MATALGIDKTKPTFRTGLRVVRMLITPHLGVFLTSVAGAAVFAGGTLLSATALGWVADDIIVATFDGEASGVATNPVSVWTGAIALAAIAFLRSAGVVTRRYYAGMTSERAERWLRRELADQYLGQPRSWIRSLPTGRLIAHVDADATVLTHALHPLPFSLGVVFLAVMSAVRLFAIDPLVAVIALLVFPLMVVTNAIYSRTVAGPLAEQQAAVASVAGIAHESFEGAMIVKTLGRQTAEVDRFDDASGVLQNLRVRVGFIRSWLDLVLSSLPLVATMVVIIIGGYRVRAGAMTAGDVVEVAALYAALAIPMLVFGFLLESLIPSVVAWNRLRPVVESPIAQGEQVATELRPGALDVEVAGLSYAFPDEPDEVVVHDVSLTVDAGQMVAIVGQTGSGKSTLCAALGGVLDEVGDAVRVGGVAMTDLSPELRAKRIAYVFQEPFLFSGSIRSNVDIGGTRTDAEVLAACTDAALEEWIDTLPDGLETVVGERGVTVSGGQRQRIALARALMSEADLVILDDATSAVDTIVEERILDRLRSGRGATMLIVAHRLSTIERADRVIYMQDGKIHSDGLHTELLDDPSYRELVMAYAEAAADGQ